MNIRQFRWRELCGPETIALRINFTHINTRTHTHSPAHRPQKYQSNLFHPLLLLLATTEQADDVAHLYRGRTVRV